MQFNVTVHKNPASRSSESVLYLIAGMQPYLIAWMRIK